MVRCQLFLTGLFGLLLFPVQAQESFPICPFSRITETHLVETWWQYQHTLHVSSQTIVHHGETDYASFLHFRYDLTGEVSIVGQIQDHPWRLSGGKLFFPYRTDTVFCVEQPDPRTLYLTYQSAGQQEDYRYVFRKVEPGATPFVRPWYELPTVLVARDKLRKQPVRNKVPWWAFWRRWQEPPTVQGPPPIRIQIEVAGGGYYGGINPVYRQFVKINSEGRLIREVQTAREGLMTTRKNIARNELEAFVYWIRDQGFFDLAREYDCTEQLCHRRKGEQPRPMPLQVKVTLGHQTKMVNIPIWGMDNKHVQYIQYPPVIDQIVETVYKMADRMDGK